MFDIINLCFEFLTNRKYFIIIGQVLLFIFILLFLFSYVSLCHFFFMQLYSEIMHILPVSLLILLTTEFSIFRKISEKTFLVPNKDLLNNYILMN